MNRNRIDTTRAVVLLTFTVALLAPAGCGGCPCRKVEAAPDGEAAQKSTTRVEVVAPETPAEPGTAAEAPAGGREGESEGAVEVPLVRPERWDAIAFNRDRGNAGAIPESYLGDVNGPDGEQKHLGKHLPYIADTSGLEVPEGYLALMWGDPAKGYARHPNAPKGAKAYPEGHWYDWIRVRKAAAGQVEESETRFSGWPEAGADDTGKYLVAGGGSIEEDGGKNTVYLVRLPADVKPGDTIRIWAHCIYHGEYVDFIEVK